MSRSVKRFASWLAAFALMFGALAPTLAHAWPHGGVAPMSEICSATGAPAVHVDEASPDAPPASMPGHAFDHCPYCSLHLTALGFPPTPAQAAAPALPAFELPHLFLFAPRGQHAWTAAPARAPPLAG